MQGATRVRLRVRRFSWNTVKVVFSAFDVSLRPRHTRTRTGSEFA